MKNETRKVSRTVTTINGDETKEKQVEFQVAESPEEMLSVCGGDLKKALKYFNDGRWSEIRTETSNELAGGTPEEKAFAKIVKTLSKLPMFAGKTEDEVREAVKANPALMVLFGSAPAAN